VSLKKGWHVLLTIGTIVVLAVIGIAVGDMFDKKESRISNVKNNLLPMNSNAKSRKTRQARNTGVSKSMDPLEKSLPIAFRADPFATRFVEESKRYHKWFSIIFFYSTQFSRVFRLLSLSVSVIVMLFMQAVTYNIVEPDDGTCEAWSNEQYCLAEKSRLASDASMCFWTNATIVASCHYQETSNDIMRTLYVAVVSSLLSAPLALFQNWLFLHILGGSDDDTDENKKHISAATVAPLNSKSLHRQGGALFRDEKYFACSADQEYEMLKSGVVSYRNTLNDVQQSEFDGKLF
jgi:hypothetical protein